MKNCKNCGAANGDGANWCQNCGSKLEENGAPQQAANVAQMPPYGAQQGPQAFYGAPQGTPPPYGAQPPYGNMPPYGAYQNGYQQGRPNYYPAGTVPNHLGKAIISLFLFTILGIIALVYATQVDSKLAAGDLVGAEQASRTANTCANAGIIVGIVVVAITLIITIFYLILLFAMIPVYF